MDDYDSYRELRKDWQPSPLMEEVQKDIGDFGAYEDLYQEQSRYDKLEKERLEGISKHRPNIFLGQRTIFKGHGQEYLQNQEAYGKKLKQEHFEKVIVIAEKYGRGGQAKEIAEKHGYCAPEKTQEDLAAERMMKLIEKNKPRAMSERFSQSLNFARMPGKTDPSPNKSLSPKKDDGIDKKD